MHIGLIGGIGPAATIAYYKRLVSTFKSAGKPLELTIAHANIDVLASNATKTTERPKLRPLATTSHNCRGPVVTWRRSQH